MKPLAKSLAGFAVLLLASWPGSTATAQEASAPDSLTAVRGFVTAEGTGVPGANVFLLETLEGVLADVDGRFVLPTRHRGPATLVVRMMGYRERRLPLVLPRREPVAIAIEVNAVEMAPTVVRPSVFLAGDDPDVSITNLDVVRTPGAAADVFRALQTFPGVQPVDEGAGLFVRGGDVAETRVFLNETLVLAPYRNESPTGGAFGVFDPFLLDGIFFSSGGFGARYGDALSGVAALRTQGRPPAREIGVSASLAALSGRGGLPWKNGWGARATATRSYTGLLFDLNGTTREYTHDPEGRDLSGSLIWNYRPTGEIKLFGLDQRNQMGVRIDEPAFSGAFETESENDQLALSWRDQVGSTRPSLSVGTSGSAREQGYGAFALATDERFDQARARLEWDAGERVTLSAGGDLEWRDAHYRGTFPQRGYDQSPDAATTVVDSRVEARRSGLYVEADWDALDRLHLTAGLRSDRSTLDGASTFDPRASASFRAGPSIVLTAAWGIYHQRPAPLLYEPATGDPGLPAMEARHWIVGGQLERPAFSLRVEAYDKAYRDLAQVTRDRGVAGGGTGTSRGVDLFLRWRGWSWLQGRVSYSWLHARRTDPNTGTLERSAYDITHAFSAIVDRAWTARWRTSLALRTASGRPFTPVVDAAFDSVQGVWVPTYGAPSSERLPAYHRVDLSTSYMRSLWNGNRTIFFLSVNNILDRENLFGYRYPADYAQRLPIRSQFKRSIYAGATFLL